MHDDVVGDPLFDLAAGRARSEAERARDGEGVAAAARTESGTELIGVWIDAMVDSACLCAETGPICESHRAGDAIAAMVCVRWTDTTGAIVLPACGVCQERLAVFGTDVLIAVDHIDGTTRYRSLSDLRPTPWWDSIEA